MDIKDYPKVRREAERQGWRVEPTSNGEMFYSPNGVDKAAWHTPHVSSSPRALDHLVRQLGKGGFRWPPPKRT